MAHLHRNNASCTAGTIQIAALVETLSRSVAILNADIESEEIRTGSGDPSHRGYSPLASSLRARRDNLQATINSLIPLIWKTPRAA